jgi:uncharacterized membrane protein
MAPDPTSERDQDELPGVDRLLTLSDGVVAIALTLLVLQLKVPTPAEVGNVNSATDLASHLWQGGGQITSYLISFYVISQFWLAHHRTFRDIAGHREGLAWWNFAFLLTITLIPFTSNVLGDYGSNPLAIDIFAVNLLLASLTTQATYVFARRLGLVTRINVAMVRRGQVRTVGLAIAVALSIGVSWVNTEDAKYCWLLIALTPFVANRWAGGVEPGEGVPDGASSPAVGPPTDSS